MMARKYGKIVVFYLSVFWLIIALTGCGSKKEVEKKSLQHLYQ